MIHPFLLRLTTKINRSDRLDFSEPVIKESILVPQIVALIISSIWSQMDVLFGIWVFRRELGYHAYLNRISTARAYSNSCVWRMMIICRIGMLLIEGLEVLQQLCVNGLAQTILNWAPPTLVWRPVTGRPIDSLTGRFWSSESNVSALSAITSPMSTGRHISIIFLRYIHWLTFTFILILHFVALFWFVAGFYPVC